MGNMGYCRFQNTVGDLADCFEHMEDDLGDEEERARKRLIKLCQKITDEYGDPE